MLQNSMVNQQRRNQELVDQVRNARAREAQGQQGVHAPLPAVRGTAHTATPTHLQSHAAGISGPIQAQLTEPSASATPRTPGSSQSNCLKLSKEASRGELSTESTSLINHCGYRVAYSYCVTSPSGGGSMSCNKRAFGSGHVSANSESAISIMGTGSDPIRVHWMECANPQKPNGYPAALPTRFDGSRIWGKCD